MYISSVAGVVLWYNVEKGFCSHVVECLWGGVGAGQGRGGGAPKWNWFWLPVAP